LAAHCEPNNKAIIINVEKVADQYQAIEIGASA
jgi:hypothetical protein